MKFLQVIVVSILLMSFVGCSSTSSQSWAEGMRGMAQSFEKLFPYMYDSQKFSDPKNAKIIETHLSELIKDSESLNKHIATGLSGNDPLFDIGLKGLKKNLKRAQESYYVESYAYSQGLLNNSVNYCVQCHTRTNLGPSFNVYDRFSPATLSKIQKEDLAKIQVATRQFDKALKSLLLRVNEEGLSSDDQLEAMKFAMTVALRNLTSAKKASSFLRNSQVHSKNKKYVQQWKKDLSHYENVSLKAARKYRVLPNKSNAQFIQSLNNSLVLHQSLSVEQDRGKRARIYYALGNIYKNYSSIGAAELPEQYFEACIHQMPYTTLAKKCYFNLEKRLLDLYKVEEFKRLPKEELKNMYKLKALSGEKKATNRPLGGHDSL